MISRFLGKHSFLCPHLGPHLMASLFCTTAKHILRIWVFNSQEGSVILYMITSEQAVAWKKHHPKRQCFYQFGHRGQGEKLLVFYGLVEGSASAVSCLCPWPQGGFLCVQIHSRSPGKVAGKPRRHHGKKMANIQVTTARKAVVSQMAVPCQAWRALAPWNPTSDRARPRERTPPRCTRKQPAGVVLEACATVGLSKWNGLVYTGRQ